MTPDPSHVFFASEAAWPFRLRTEQLAECQTFLSMDVGGARLLRIFGSSGVGKSFLVRELMVQLATGDKDEVGIYLDVPAADYESSRVLDRLGVLLSTPQAASRDAPTFVGKKVARAWASATRGVSKTRAYGYQASRDLTGQIPVAGPFVRALLPATMPARASADVAPLRFLMKRSASKRVVLVLDNVQFLSTAMREMFDMELAEAGQHLRLVLIERVNGRRRVNWTPPLPNVEIRDVDLEHASLDDVVELVSDVMPGAVDGAEIAATVFRRSEGNLKSVWFQLRLIAGRRTEQSAASYEDVILTLAPLDQTVLRYVVFTVGGLQVPSLALLLQASELRAQPDDVASSVSDLAALGLLVVNGDMADRVRVEHELVAQVVTEVTPEEEKLELRAQIVSALGTVLDRGAPRAEEAVLYDRLVGIVTGVELRQRPSLMSHVVTFVHAQAELDRHRYLASLCQDTACWEVLDVLPETTVRALLDAVQKSSQFAFGLVATTRLRESNGRLESLASLYEAKYLVQLFRYEDARRALDRVVGLPEARSVEFNIVLGLARDEEAAAIAAQVQSATTPGNGTEEDYVILRNSIHLVEPDKARVFAESALAGFEALGRAFGAATALNNLGIVELAAGDLEAARTTFAMARDRLAQFDSPEVYQPLVNLSAVAILDGDLTSARELLAAARQAAPRSLIQDHAMFELNALALDILGASCSPTEGAARGRHVLTAARQTRDKRFVDVATWFAAVLDRAVAGAPPASNEQVTGMRESGRVALELFVPALVRDVEIEVPFALSPFWRH